MMATTATVSPNSTEQLALPLETLRHVFGSEFADAFLQEQHHHQHVPEAKSTAVAASTNEKANKPSSTPLAHTINRATTHSHTSKTSKASTGSTSSSPSTTPASADKKDASGPSPTPTPVPSGPAELLLHHMVQKLESTVSSDPNIAAHSGTHVEGRLGPKVVKFDQQTHMGSFVMSSDRLGLNSQSNFASIRANVCVFKGKWQYEVQLASNGIMQIGWATMNTKFTGEKGVGDSEDSYGYDGNRVRKWNVTASPYGGQLWRNGDIIGCCINLDDATIEYYRNGVSLGPAFTDIHTGAGIAYFPAVSLTYSEGVVANFGASPFLFPIPNYEPLQSPKMVEDIKATLLLSWLEKLVDIYPSHTPAAASTTDATATKSTVIITNQLFRLLEENIHSAYVIEHTLLPFLAKQLGLPADIKTYDATTAHLTPTGKLPRVLDLMWVYFEELVMKSTMERLAIILMNYVKAHTFSFAYPYQMYSVQVLIGLVEHRETRRYFLHHLLFDKTRLTNFLYVRPLDEDTLKTVITTPWWPGKSADNSPEARAYERACNSIHERVLYLEGLQVNLLKVLMTNSDGKETRPSSRSIFLRMLRNFIADTLRHGPGALHPINKPMCTFFRLLKTVSSLWASEVGQDSKSHSATPATPDIPPAMFYDASIDYYDLDRVGGLPNHLFKTYHVEVSQALNIPDYYTPRDAAAAHVHGFPQFFVSGFGASEDESSDGTHTHRDTPFPSIFGLMPGVQITQGSQGPGPGNVQTTAARSAPAIRAAPTQPTATVSEHPLPGDDVSTETHETGTSAVPLSEDPSIIDISIVPGPIPANQANQQQQQQQQHEIATQIIGGRNFVELLPDLIRGQSLGPTGGGPTPTPMNPATENQSNAESLSMSDTSSVSVISDERSQNSNGFGQQAGFMSGGNVFMQIPGLGQGMGFTLFPGGLFGFGAMGRQIRPKNPREAEISRSRGAMDIRTSLRELLDDIILIFTASVSSHVEKVVGIRTMIDEYIEALAKAKEALAKDAGKLSPVQKVEINRSIEVFSQKLSEEVKHMTWIKSALFTPERQSLIVAMLKSVLTALKQSSNLGLLFQFTPDIYVSTLVKLTTFLVNHMHPTVPFQQIQGFPVLCRDIAEFTALHFNDSRIILSETKDTLTQALSKFVCDRTMLTAIESMPIASQTEMVKSLLRPYENRAWAQSNWMLVRIWQGNGFGFQYLNCASARKSYRRRGVQDEFGISTDLPPTPSPILQNHVKNILLSDQKTTSSYIHSLLNQLNWSFSEFIGLLQEIHAASSQSHNVTFDHRQLKVCCTCFELTQALLRVVEMIICIASPVLTDFSKENAESLLERLCMLLSQVLNRVASVSGTFGQVLDLELAGLDTITYYAILTSVAGIFVALLRNELKITDKSKLRVTKTILLEPSLQISSLDFLLGESRGADGASQQQQAAFSLHDYVPQDLTPAELQAIEKTIAHLKKWNGEFQQDMESISDENICTICYAYPKTTTFLPCNHRTCRACITHHLLNKHQCFFCKRKIEKVIADDGTVVYEANPDEVNLSGHLTALALQGGPGNIIAGPAPRPRSPAPPAPPSHPHDEHGS